MRVRTFPTSLSVLVFTVGLAQAQSLQSASLLEFAGADTLFVADSIAGTIHAVEVPDIGGAPGAVSLHGSGQLHGHRDISRRPRPNRDARPIRAMTVMDLDGVATTPIPLSGVFQAADHDAQFLLMLRRNMDTGTMDLVSFRKGAYFRLSECVSEYNFPDDVYASDQRAEGTRMFRNMLEGDEGYPDQMR